MKRLTSFPILLVSLVGAVAGGVWCARTTQGEQPVAKEPTLKLEKIGVILLGVTDIERSLAFYRDRLGMTVQFANEGFVFLQGGGLTLGLSRELAKARQPVAGATEIVFSVANVREAHAALAARGVVFNREPRVIDGTNWAANFLDPDGHQLSVFGPPGNP